MRHDEFEMLLAARLNMLRAEQKASFWRTVRTLTLLGVVAIVLLAIAWGLVGS